MRRPAGFRNERTVRRRLVDFYLQPDDNCRENTNAPPAEEKINMKIRRRLDFLLTASWCLGLLLLAGCASERVTSELPVAGRILPPDRILVHRFQVVPQGSEYGTVPFKQSAEELRVGRLLGEAIATNLVAELKARGVNAAMARDDAPPKEQTVWIFGRFMHLESPRSSNLVGGYTFADPLHTRVLIFQGSGSNVQAIAQADTETDSGVRLGMAPEAEKAAVDADAKRVAKEAADRIAGYYRKHGFMK